LQLRRVSQCDGIVQVLTPDDIIDFHLPVFKRFPFHISLDTDNKQA